jgi:predicted RNA-binding protein
MCESNAYLVNEESEELIMENVDFLKPVGKSVILRSIFGEERTIEASIRELDLTKHRIVLETS